jgi:hypothetical protein
MPCPGGLDGTCLLAVVLMVRLACLGCTYCGDGHYVSLPSLICLQISMVLCEDVCGLLSDIQADCRLLQSSVRAPARLLALPLLASDSH